MVLSKVMFYTAGEKLLSDIFSFTSLTLLAADKVDLSPSHRKLIMIPVIFFLTEEKHLSAQGF